jgi:hypothetical protein
MEGPILVVLAAGMGSRYGGLKQIDRIGKNGEVLLDYSVYDAIRSGFKKIVYIIRRDMEKEFREIVMDRTSNKIQCDLVFQELDSLITPELMEYIKKAGRTKPWGTAHALLCAESCIDAPFVVINADDFYGREAFKVMGKYLTFPGLNEGAIIPYKLENTLSLKGTVTRGICDIRDGYLQSVDEQKAIEKHRMIIFNTTPDGKLFELTAETPVSMNFWGFPLAIFPDLRRYFDDFIQNFGNELKNECYIPLFADWLIQNNLLKIKALHADSEWFGVTYQEDHPAAQKRIIELTETGVYPASLWN